MKTYKKLFLHVMEFFIHLEIIVNEIIHSIGNIICIFVIIHSKYLDTNNVTILHTKISNHA